MDAALHQTSGALTAWRRLSIRCQLAARAPQWDGGRASCIDCGQAVRAIPGRIGYPDGVPVARRPYRLSTGHRR